MKIVAFGDIHGRSIWKLAVAQNPDADVFVCMGDEFDTHEPGITAAQQIHNFKELVEFKKTSEKEVILLIGNHTHHYFQSVGYTGTSGWQSGASPNITQVLEENKHILQMAYSIDGLLFTHAGVSEVFLDEVFGKDGWKSETIASQLNELWKEKPRAFCFNPSTGYDQSGDSDTQTPIWIRPANLLRSSKNLRKEYIQIVGHTQMRKIDLEGKSTGKKYFFIDTLGTSKEYLIVDNNEFKTGQL